MSDVNKVFLVGRLGNDPQLRGSAQNRGMASASLYTKAVWKDSESGETKEKSERHNIVFFGGQANYASKHLRKGSRVFVEGRLQTRKYQDANTKLDKYVTEIVVSDVLLLSHVSKTSDGSEATASAATASDETTNQRGEDMPF
jgi:single-strand DNA-binding protein